MPGGGNSMKKGVELRNSRVKEPGAILPRCRGQGCVEGSGEGGEARLPSSLPPEESEPHVQGAAMSLTVVTGHTGLASTVLEVQGPLRYAAGVKNTQDLD